MKRKSCYDPIQFKATMLDCSISPNIIKESRKGTLLQRFWLVEFIVPSLVSIIIRTLLLPHCEAMLKNGTQTMMKNIYAVSMRELIQLCMLQEQRTLAFSHDGEEFRLIGRELGHLRLVYTAHRLFERSDEIVSVQHTWSLYEMMLFINHIH